MYSLQPPAHSAIETYKLAVSSIQNDLHQQKYMDAMTEVQACCDLFDELASAGKFDEAKDKDFGISSFGKDDMADLYDKQFTKNEPTRNIRDSIRALSNNGLCPYCGDGIVYELDHYLPKRPFSGIAVHPGNLVPICRDCNRVKLNYYPSISNPAILHPYFDSVYEDRWLTASVVQGFDGLPVAEFSVELENPDSALQARLEAHMQELGLFSRFKVRASQTFESFEGLLESPLGNNADLRWAKNHLSAMAFSLSCGRENTWQFAIHMAMAQDPWYLPLYFGLK